MTSAPACVPTLSFLNSGLRATAKRKETPLSRAVWRSGICHSNRKKLEQHKAALYLRCYLHKIFPRLYIKKFRVCNPEGEALKSRALLDFNCSAEVFLVSSFLTPPPCVSRMTLILSVFNKKLQYKISGFLRSSAASKKIENQLFFLLSFFY